MKYLLIIPICLLLNPFLNGQTDPGAMAVLEKFSENALAAQSVTMEFFLTIDDAVEDIHSRSEGECVIKGDMYKLTLPENIIWFTGEAIYTLVPEVNEVTITEPDPGNDTFTTAPSAIFTMYREGYKIRLVDSQGGESVIDLYPEELTAEFSRIRLKINKSYDLVSAEYRRKDGFTMLLEVKEYDLKKSYKDSFFSFDPKKFGDVDIIDMRF